MKHKLKIAIYSGVIPSTTFIERLINGLSKSGISIYLFGFVNEKIRYNTSVFLVTYRNTKIQKGLHLITYSFLLFCFKFKDKKKLDGILKGQSKNVLLAKVKCYPVLWHKPDIFHVQWAKGLEDWMWLKEFGVKIVLSLRGAHINYSPIADLKLAAMYRKNFPKVDGFHAVSKAIAQEAEKYGAQKSKISVVYSGLDLDANTSLNQPDNSIFQIISIGRPHWKKGYTYALDACKILKDNNINFRYTIVGVANDIELVYQVHDLNLQEEVLLLNQIPFSRVQELIKKSNLLLLSSVEEGIANVVLEAMALETLVLTTDCGGMKEVITDHENGFSVPIRDATRMAEKIIEIARLTPEQKEQIVKNALITIETKHREKHMVDGVLALYQSI